MEQFDVPSAFNFSFVFSLLVVHSNECSALVELQFDVV